MKKNKNQFVRFTCSEKLLNGSLNLNLEIRKLKFQRNIFMALFFLVLILFI